MSSADREDWSRAESYGAMGGGGEDDFSTFLDLDSIDLNFPILDGSELSLDNGAPQQTRGDAHAYAKSHYAQGDQYHERDGGADQQPPQNLQQPWMQGDQATSKRYPERLSTSGFDGSRQDEAWLQDHNFQQHFSVPPTPNSSEMYPAQYVQQQLFQQSQGYQQYRKDDGMAAFTPHESPHFVGSESSFSMPEFADPNTFNLDPLTSPAMNPQLGSTRGSVSRQSRTAESSVVGSPAPLELDEGNLSSSMNDRPRKTRKKALPPKSAPTSVGPKALSSSTTRKRKGSTATRSQVRSGVESTSKPQDGGPSPTNRAEMLNSEHNDSTSTSTSPQPPYDIAMAPPPKPGSLKSTPNLRPQPTSNPDGFPPATPASLMRLQQQNRSGSLGTSSPATHADQLHGPMEELVLPEAAAPSANMRSTAQSPQPRSVQVTPILTTNTPGSTSAVTSPIRSANGSAKGNQARNSRKRNSTSSNLVSPALRPRISPSIKPLLPDGSQHNISEETHALLLASKSNYQNLLEGNHLPGVSYPSELSTNLTSKRTSHKIAEQGRRNRINTALQEMQTLLPSSPSMSGGGPGTSPSDLNGSAEDEAAQGSKTPATPAQTANSKAATVELAIDYIKKLNNRLADTEIENGKLRQEMAALKAKLGAEA